MFGRKKYQVVYHDPSLPPQVITDPISFEDANAVAAGETADWALEGYGLDDGFFDVQPVSFDLELPDAIQTPGKYKRSFRVDSDDDDFSIDRGPTIEDQLNSFFE